MRHKANGSAAMSGLWFLESLDPDSLDPDGRLHGQSHCPARSQHIMCAAHNLCFPAMANLTLSIPDEVLQSARAAAFKRGTTVNAVCREALERLIGPDNGVLAAIERA